MNPAARTGPIILFYLQNKIKTDKKKQVISFEMSVLKTPHFYGYNVKFSPHSQLLGLVGGSNFGLSGKIYGDIFFCVKTLLSIFKINYF